MIELDNKKSMVRKQCFIMKFTPLNYMTLVTSTVGHISLNIFSIIRHEDNFT